MIADRILKVLGQNGETWVRGTTVVSLHRAQKSASKHRFTLSGAVRFAYFNMRINDLDPKFHKANELVQLAVHDVLGFKESIPYYNDHVAKDFSDIIKVLDRVRELEAKRFKAVA